MANNQQPSTPRSESTPERKSRLEAMASLRASIEAQISDLSTKLNELETHVSTLPEEYLTEDSVSMAINEALAPLSEMIASSQVASASKVDALKEHLDENLDEL